MSQKDLRKLICSSRAKRDHEIGLHEFNERKRPYKPLQRSPENYERPNINRAALSNEKVKRAQSSIQEPKRQRLELEPGELQSSVESDSESLSEMSISSENSTIPEIKFLDFEFEDVIRNFKLPMAIQPVPLISNGSLFNGVPQNDNCKLNETKAVSPTAFKALAKEEKSKEENLDEQLEGKTSSKKEGIQLSKVCIICGLEFDTQSFQDHLFSTHECFNHSRGVISCPICQELFTNQTSFLRHFDNHENTSRSNQETKESVLDDSYDDRSPPRLEVDVDFSPEIPVEKHETSTLTNGTSSEADQSLNEKNSSISSQKQPHDKESDVESLLSNVQSESKILPKEDLDKSSKVLTSLPPITLPPLALKIEKLPPLPPGPLLSPTPKPANTSFLPNAVRDPRISRRSISSYNFNKSIAGKDNIVQSQLPDSMILPVTRSPSQFLQAKTARQRMEDKWREPEIVKQLALEVERLNAQMKEKDENHSKIIREKEKVIERRDKKIKSLKDKLKEKSAERDDLMKKIDNIELIQKTLDQSKRESETASQREIELIVSQAQLLERCNTLERNGRESSHKHSKHLIEMSEDVAKKTYKISQLEDIIQSLKEKLDTSMKYEVENAEISAKLQSVQTQLQESEAKEEELEKDLQKSVETVSNLRTDLMYSRLESQAMESEAKNSIIRFQEKEKEYRSYWVELKEQVKELIIRHSEKDEEIERLKTQISSTPELEALKETNAFFQSVIVGLEKKITSMRMKILRRKRKWK